MPAWVAKEDKLRLRIKEEEARAEQLRVAEHEKWRQWRPMRRRVGSRWSHAGCRLKQPPLVKKPRGRKPPPRRKRLRVSCAKPG